MTTPSIPTKMSYTRKLFPTNHDDIIIWNHFLRNWPFVRGIHRSPVNSPHKGQWRRALMFSLIYAWINVWVNNREAGDLRRYRSHYDVTVMTVVRFFSSVYYPMYVISCDHISINGIARWWPWWRHQMETFSALLALCAGNSPITGEFPSQRPVTRSFDVFFDHRKNKRLSNQSGRRWFETTSRSLWRHCNG